MILNIYPLILLIGGSLQLSTCRHKRLLASAVEAKALYKANMYFFVVVKNRIVLA